MDRKILKKPTLKTALFLTLTTLSTIQSYGSAKLYPDSNYDEGPSNPHIPFIAPESGGATGNHLDAEKKMLFHLTPFIDISKGGSITVFARDNRRRISKDLLQIRNKKQVIKLSILPASKGRILELQLQDVTGKWPRTISTASLKQSLTKDWTPIKINWDKSSITAKVSNNEAKLSIPNGVPTKELIAFAWHIDDLTLKADGEFKLNWDSGYAAKIKPKQNCKVVTTRLFGFDTMMITPDKSKRESPKIQVINGSNQAQEITYKFDIKDEINKTSHAWEQTVTVTPLSSVMQPIELPFKLKTDIYHLNVTSNNTETPFSDEKHFMYVERRNEPSGPNKFALHHFHSKHLGAWPETLPIGKALRYNCWGYIVGPAWVKDWNGDYGLDPNTPTEEWNWNVDTDISIKAGIETGICAVSQPLLDWQREKIYTKKGMMGKLAWGLRGGKTNAQKYRKFVKALAERYKGKVKDYEVENEPNAPHGLMAEDYTPVLKAVYEEVHAVDPDAKVYGICGTANFLDYMNTVFKDGGAKYMDGVSWHTYTSPRLPDAVGLYGFLQQANEIIKKGNKPLLRRNTETGIYTAHRYEVDKPISPEKIDDLINKGVEPFATTKGWHRHVLNEWDAARSLVTNVTYNFLAGAHEYTFFGWATDPARLKKMGSVDIFSGTLDKKKQTPNLHSLAAGVMTAQYEGVIPKTGELINTLGLKGGIFSKKNNGELAVLWVPSGEKTILLESSDKNLEAVSSFGQTISMGSITFQDKQYYQLSVGKQPIYIHTRVSGLKFESPVTGIKATQLPDLTESSKTPRKQFNIQFKLTNYFNTTWTDTITFQTDNGAQLKTHRADISLESGESKVIENTLILPGKTTKTKFIWGMFCKSPNGKKISFYKAINAKPKIMATKLRDGISLKEMVDLDMPAKMINTNEQCQVGRPPKLSSLQEEQYWKGPDELSGKVKIGYNNEGVLISIKVKDQNARLSKNKIGVDGSCIEMFFDFRTPENGQGTPSYQKGVYQYLIRPAIKVNQKTIMKNCTSASSPDLEDVTLKGEPIDAHNYWIGMKIPWTSLGLTEKPKVLTFGFDVAIDSPFPHKDKRKTQMILFGTASNNVTADKFGQCIIDTK